MRKLVVFLLVFGIGAAILWFVESRRRAPARVEQEIRPSTESPGAPGDEGAVPAPMAVDGVADEQGGESAAQEPETPAETRIEVSGEVEFSVFDDATGLKRYTFEAELEPGEGGLYQARALRIESFDPVEGTLTETVVAERGEVRIEWAEAASEARLGDDGRVQLFDVTVTQEAGGPLAPMVLRTPALVAELDLGTYRSAPGEPVDVQGRGFTAEGEDVTLSTTAGRLLLENGGRFRFVAKDGRTATFSTDEGDPLLLQRIGVAGDGAFEASSEQGGLLEFGDDPPGRATAQSIRLLGRSVGEAVLLERGRAEGRVEAERGRDRFTGESATLRFDDAGAVGGLVLEDEPTWTVLLEEQGAQPLTLEGSGEGPLTADFTENRFDLVGKSFLRAREQDLELRAQAGIGGTLGSDRRDGVVEARGDVRATRGDMLLETSRLQATFRVEDERTTTFVCNEQTRIEGPDRSGRTLVLDASEGLTVTVRGEQWYVPEARGARLSAQGEQAFEASAGTVRDLDWSARTCTAEGGVRYRSELGEGEAVRAVASSDTQWELYGLPGAPVRFRLDSRGEGGAAGSFEALSIDLTSRRLEAREAVRAEIRASDRVFRADSETAVLTLEDPVEGRTPFTYVADDVSEASAARADDETRLTSDRMVVRGWLDEDGDAVLDEEREVEASELVATGRVRLAHGGEVDIGGAGERFVLSASGTGRLEPGPGQRVSAWGVLPGSGKAYELTAESIDFEAEALRAQDPHLFIDATLMPISPAGDAQPGFTEARGRELRADELGVLLDGDVEVHGTDRRGRGLEVHAGTVFLAAATESTGGAGRLDSVEAWGGFEATYAGNGRARGECFSARREWAALDGSPAVAEMSGYALESTRIEVDLANFLVTTERGVVRPENPGAWLFEFASMRPVLRGAETMMTIASPVYTAGDSGAHADWAVFWLDGDRWRERGRQKLFGERPESRGEPGPPLPERDLVPGVFRRLYTGEVSELLRAVYLEGEVETTEEGRRSAAGDSVYLDLQEQVGTITGAEIVFRVGVGDDREVFRTRANEIQVAANGTLNAENATITACDHDVPHYVIGTGELILDPRDDGTWRFSANDNILQIADGIQVPLPSIGKLVFDESGDIQGYENAEGEVVALQAVGISNTPRFGTSLSTRFRTDLGSFGHAIGGFLGFDQAALQGRWKQDAAWLGSRGPLLSSGLELREKTPSATDQEVWLDVNGSAVHDTGNDEGLIVVDEADRSTLRTWFHARGRYPFSDQSWLDLAWSDQSDAGVQSEFFEDDFLDFEERETYLHWRRASGSNYAEARVQTRVDGFRTQIERLPAAGLYNGETRVASIGEFPLLYGGSVDVDVMRRRAGEFEIENGRIVDQDGHPLGQDNYKSFDLFNDRLEEVFLDGLGNRDVVRADTIQRLSLPMSLGLAGMKATPFVDGRLTAWDKGVDESDSPTRAGLFAGVELATTLWKIDEYGFDNVISPSVRFQQDVASDTSDGTAVIFDEADQDIEGTEIDAGVRTRWWRVGDENQLDLELRGIRRYDRAGDLDNETQILVLGDLSSHIESMPVGVRHDARYDADDGTTIYSRTVFAIAPTDDLVLELGYNRGVNQDEERLFEAAGLAARFRATPKWELEAKEVFAIKGGGNLNNEFTVRRFSHDFLIEFSVGTRSGEGGTAFTINFIPLLAWQPSRSGLLGR